MGEEDLKRMLSDSKEFKHLINHNGDLIHAAKEFPAHAKSLITCVLSDPEEFKRLIKDNNELRDTAKQFPTYSVLQSASSEKH